MLKIIKDWLFYRAFDSNARPNGHRSNGINNMHTICILFDGTEEEDRKIVHKFKKTISPDGKRNIKSLAFINNQLPLDNIDYSAYNLQNIKWYGLPLGEKVAEFIQFKCDILIVLCKSMLPHFEYIIAHAESKFVIGPSIDKSEKYFDIIIDADASINIENLIKKILTAIDKIAIK